MFIEAGRLYIPDGSPNDAGAFFLNTQDNALEAAYPAGQWLKIRPPLLPREARAVMLGGMLLITQSQSGSGCNLTVALRRPGYAWDAAYFWQCIEYTPGSGQRSPVTAIVPCVLGEFELKWVKSPAGILPDWPVAPAFGINLSMMGYWL